MKKDVILAVLITFCLTVTLFSLVPSKSATGDYDPWADINDDGKIDMKDIGYAARLFGTTGTAINKTELLLGLQAQIDTLNATIAELQNNNSELENRVRTLEGIYGLPMVNISGLIGYWRFDGLGNNAADSSGNDNYGTLYGPSWVDGRYGKAVSLDGVDDYVKVSQSPSLDIVDGISVAAWIYPKASPDFVTVLSRWYDGSEPDRGIVLQLMNGNCFFAVIDDNNHLSAPFSFEINNWYYLTATWNGSVSKIYVNGMEIGYRSTSGSFTNQNINLGIGSDLNPFHAQFNGSIDNVMIYNRALTAEEIALHYLLPPS